MTITPEQFAIMRARVNAAPVEREADLHAQILDYCHRQEPQWVAIHSRMDAATTTDRGVPDFVILAPGRVLLVECKRRGGKLSIHQQAWHKRAEAVGHRVVTVTSLREFVEETR